MIPRALFAAAAAAVVFAVPPALAEPVIPPPKDPAAEPSRQTGEGQLKGLSELIQSPTRIHSEVLAGLPADDAFLGSRGVALRSLRESIESEQLRLEWAVDERTRRAETVRIATADEQTETSELADAEQHLAGRQSDLLTMSVDAFLNGSDKADLSVLLSATTANASSQATQALRQDRLTGSATLGLVNDRDSAEAARTQKQRQRTAASERLDREVRMLEDAATVEAAASTELGALEPQVGPAERRFERELLTKTLPGTNDLPIVAIDAYFNASQIAFERWPQCRIAWHQLAGVGRVESFHGNFGASSIDQTGQTSPRILGPQLNGDPWLAIPDTDGGELDGDLEWDRAVGPMQFIPTSWALFAADGNRDGRSDPHNLYDAAVAAADHLCGSGLDSPDRFQRALLGYNRSVQYGHDVMTFGDGYEASTDIVDPWTLQP